MLCSVFKSTHPTTIHMYMYVHIVQSIERSINQSNGIHFVLGRGYYSQLSPRFRPIILYKRLSKNAWLPSNTTKKLVQLPSKKRLMSISNRWPRDSTVCVSLVHVYQLTTLNGLASHRGEYVASTCGLRCICLLAEF